MPRHQDSGQSLDVSVRAVRVGDEEDAAFRAAQASQVAAGAAPWHVEAAITASARDAILNAVLAHRDPETILIAEDAAAHRLGFVFVLATSDPLTCRAQGSISDIVVAPEAEGRGVGQRLLAAAEAWASARGCRSLTLHVFPENTRARELYERQG